MNKLRPLIFFLSAVFLIQSCKKDTIVATAYTTAAFQANINGAVWAPDTLGSSITYDGTAKSKTFYCYGTKDQKQVIFSVTLNNAGNTQGFTTGTYNIDSLSGVWAQYKTWQQNSQGNYVFLPHGNVEPNSGSITISAVDSVKKQISGTFSFYSRSTAYDDQGNVISTDIDHITGGVFNSIPYTFTSN